MILLWLGTALPCPLDTLTEQLHAAQQAGQAEEALRLATERVECATERAEQQGQAWLDLALIRESSGDFEGSLPAWEQVAARLEAGPDRASAWLRIGLNRGMEGDLEGGIADLERAVAEAAAGSQRIDARLWLARVLAKGGRPDDSLALLESIQPITDDDSERLAVTESIAWAEIMEQKREAGDPRGALDAAHKSLQAVAHTDGMDRVMAELGYGQRLLESGQTQQSLAHLELAQEAFANGAPGTEGDLIASSSLARAYGKADRPEDALPLAQRAVEIAVAGYGPEHAQTGMARAHLAAVLHGMGRDEEAEATFRSALTVLSAALGPLHPEVLFIEHDRIALQRDMGHPNLALAGVERLLGQLSQVYGPRHPDLVATAKLRCELLRSVGRLPEALACATRARELLVHSLGDHPTVVDAWSNEALVLDDLGDIRGALDRIDHAIEVQGRLEEDPATLASLQIARARALNAMGDEQGAVDALGKRPPTDPSTQAVWHIVRGEVLSRTHPDQANEEFDQALAGASSPENRSAAYAGLGFANLQLGNLPLAETQLAASVAASAEAYGESDPRMVNALYNLTLAHVARGDGLAALATLERIIHTLEGAGITEHPTLALTYAAVGGLLARETPDEMRTTLARALEMAESTLGPEHPDTAFIRSQVASSLYSMGDSQAALPYALHASASYESLFGATHPRTLEARVIEAAVLMELDRADEALVLLDAADRAIIKSLGKRSTDRANILTIRAGSHGLVGDLEAARDDSSLALELEGDLLQTTLASSERQRLAAVRKGQIPLGVYLQTETDSARAYTRGLRWKGLASAAFMGQSEPNPELAEVRNQLAALAFSPPQSMTAPDRRDALESLSQRKDALQADVGGERKQINWREVCRGLPDSAAVVDFFPSLGFVDGKIRPTLLAFVLRGGDCGEVQRVEFDAEAVATAHRRYRKVVASRGGARVADRVGSKLREVLWDPLLAALGERTDLTLIPDPNLADISFAGLLDGDGAYLVERYSLRTATHLREVGARDAGVDLSRSLIVGGVEYGADASETSERAGCGWSSFGSLPGSLDEVKALRKTLGRRGEVQQITGSNATEANIRSAIGSASVVHLATHGFHAGNQCAFTALDGDKPALGKLDTYSLVVGMNPMLLSGLALAGANDREGRDGLDDGVLTAEEVAGLELDADLVVLSACETGLGDVAPGEGVLGLQRGFRQAGARRILYSLWQVPDEATRDLMKAFYTELSAGLPPEEALRRAQVQLLRRNRRRLGEGRPTDWAAFVLGG